MILSTECRNGGIDGITGVFDLGSTYAGGRIVILDGATVLVTLVCNTPMFGAGVAGVAAIDVDPVITANGAADGDADGFRIEDRDGNSRATGTVGTSGADLNLTNTSIATGQPVTITGGSLTQPAS